MGCTQQGQGGVDEEPPAFGSGISQLLIPSYKF